MSLLDKLSAAFSGSGGMVAPDAAASVRRADEGTTGKVEKIDVQPQRADAKPIDGERVQNSDTKTYLLFGALLFSMATFSLVLGSIPIGIYLATTYPAITAAFLTAGLNALATISNPTVFIPLLYSTTFLIGAVIIYKAIEMGCNYISDSWAAKTAKTVVKRGYNGAKTVVKEGYEWASWGVGKVYNGAIAVKDGVVSAGLYVLKDVKDRVSNYDSGQAAEINESRYERLREAKLDFIPLIASETSTETVEDEAETEEVKKEEVSEAKPATSRRAFNPHFAAAFAMGMQKPALDAALGRKREDFQHATTAVVEKATSPEAMKEVKERAASISPVVELMRKEVEVTGAVQGSALNAMITQSKVETPAPTPVTFVSPRQVFARGHEEKEFLHRPSRINEGFKAAAQQAVTPAAMAAAESRMAMGRDLVGGVRARMEGRTPVTEVRQQSKQPALAERNKTSFNIDVDVDVNGGSRRGGMRMPRVRSPLGFGAAMVTAFVGKKALSKVG